MKKKIMIGTVIAISAIVFAVCKISGNQNRKRNTTAPSDLDDFMIDDDDCIRNMKE